MSYENFPLDKALGPLTTLLPLSLELPTATLSLNITTTPTPDSIVPCLKLLKTTIGDLYVKHKGKDWIPAKIEEMLEEGLMYLTYTHDDQVVAFMSLVLTLDDDELLLYLYEIHVDPQYHGQKIGGLFMTSLHQLAQSLKNGEVSVDDVDVTQIRGTKLTVFPDNDKAVKWYKSMGYKLSRDSPKDRKLRSGKVLKPDYYMLEKLV